MGNNRDLMCGVFETVTVGKAQLTASSCWANRDDHCAHNARLNRIDGIGGWAAAVNQVGEWIDVDMLEDKTVYGLNLQGRAKDHNQYVTSFKVMYRCDACSDYVDLTDGSGNAQVFTGSADMNTVRNLYFEKEFTARNVRLYPLTYHNHITLRFDVIVC